MGVKKNPLSLYNLTLRQVANDILHQWLVNYHTNYNHYSNELKNNIGVIIPYTVYDQIFDLMVDSHARVIQSNLGNDYIPSVSRLIESIIVPSLRKLNLNCLRHMGTARDEEIHYLEFILMSELPNLNNLVEISLQTSGTEFTLPTCSDEMMDKIGSSCPKLRSLDIGYNHTVTDKGVECLIPSESRTGCPLLTKITLFESSVSAEGTSKLLEGLPRLKFLGYRESGQALLLFDRHSSNSSKKLELAHLNNLGTISRTCKDLFKLKCDERMINAIYNRCPKLNGLKVRVNDIDVKFLRTIESISILELVYNLGTPSSPGSNTVQYLQLNGLQLVSLSFVCDTFTTQHLKVICEHCSNLKRIWIRTNQFRCDCDILLSDRRKCSLSGLEVMFLRVGCPGFETCRIPHNVLSYVLHKSNTLLEVILAMKNTLLCDSYVHELFSSIQTTTLKHVMLLIPFKNVTLSSLNLSMATVEALISMCPQLEQLGNLLVWDVSLEEIQELRRQLKLTNSALVLLYRMMYS